MTQTGPGLCLCAGAGPEAWEPGCRGLHSCLVLHLAHVSSSTEQAWGRRPSKYFGLSLDPELCNTCTHKTYFVAFATGAWHVNLSHPTAAHSGVAWSAAWSTGWSVVCAAISVCSTQIRVLMSGMVGLLKLSIFLKQPVELGHLTAVVDLIQHGASALPWASTGPVLCFSPFNLHWFSC